MLRSATFAVLALAACGAPQVDLRHRVPLSALAPGARFWTPTWELAMGSAAAEELLLDGWWTPEPDGGWRWARGLRSELWWDAADDRAARLGFEAWAYEGAAGDGGQRVTVSVNGRRVGRVDLGVAPTERRVELPTGSLRRGRNALALDYAASAPAPGADPRDLSVAWRRMWVEHGDGASPGTSATGAFEGEALRLPWPGGVELFFDSPGRRWLVIDALEVFSPVGSGAPSARLEIVVERAEPGRGAGGRSRSASATIRPGERDFRLEIPAGEGPVRLDLVAVAEPGAPAGELRLVGAALATEGARPPVAAAPAPRRGPRPVDARPNVLIYLVDTLRADRLGCYGHPRPTSPRLDAFAAKAVLFERAMAQSSWTRPATATVLSGLDPRVHGVHRRSDRLPAEVVTLPERLSELGYETAAVVTNGNVSAAFGFQQGFESFRYLPERRKRGRHRRSRQVTEIAGAWLEERVARGETRPFFLYLHTTDPHAPYAPSPAMRERFVDRPVGPRFGTLGHLRALAAAEGPADPLEVAGLLALYDAEIAFNDHWFGVLLDRLEGLGLLRDTLVVFLSDHGEEFAEHGGWQHGRTLYQEQLHVPLVVKLPGDELAGTRRGEVVQQSDLVPTVLEVVGAPPAEGLQGRALFRREHRGALRGERVERAAFAILDLDGIRGEAVLAGDRKLIRNLAAAGRRPRRLELYRLADDPGERSELSLSEAVWAGFLEAQLRSRRSLWPAGLAGEEAVIDAQLEEELRALGYVQ
ncbi:MAG TPA: sulfatase [Thermoanaerobaculia bacterium]|nr:sulfatase [Thermoanaerobaculia bacterium]